MTLYAGGMLPATSTPIATITPYAGGPQSTPVATITLYAGGMLPATRRGHDPRRHHGGDPGHMPE
jgi:hypothetical protein